MLVDSAKEAMLLDGDTLLVLTKHYPFNDGNTPAESYLETEMPYLAARFVSVVVVATEAASSAHLIQKTPANVTAFALGFSQTRLEKVLCLVRGVLQAPFSKISSRAAKSDSNLNAQQLLFQRYYIGKALRKHSALRRLLDEALITPMQIYSFWFHDTALVACWLKREYHCSHAAARAHRYDLYHGRTRCGHLPCREYQLEGLDAVIPCSEDGSEYLKRNYPDCADKVRTGYLGTRWLPDKSSESRGDVFRLVSCSAVTGVKRVAMTADALSILDGRGIAIEWTHFGDGPELGAVRAKVQGFRNIRCRFPGNVPNAKLLNEYGRTHFDLFVNVSSSEGLPISIMEASGHGIPVLATDVGGTHEIVLEGESGKLLPESCDAETVADAILSFVEAGDDDYATMRLAARRQWQNRFRTEENVAILLSELPPSPEPQEGELVE